MRIGPGAWIAERCQFAPGTVIGHHTRVNRPAVFSGEGTTTIGPYSAIGRVLILTDNHDTNVPNLQVALNDALGLPSLIRVGDVTIGPGCWVGDDVIVVAGVTIGAGAVVGAGSVVTRDVDPFAVVAGVPARELRRRCSPEVASVLIESEWWEWPFERMSRNLEFFATDISTVEPQALAATIKG